MSDWRKHDPVGSCRIYCSFYDRCLCTVFKAKKYTALKVGFVLLNAFLLLPYAGHVLNGFSYVSNRWIWAYGMLIAYIFVKIYPELFTLTLKEKRKIFVMLLIYCGIALLPDAARTQRNMMAVIFLVAATFTVLSFGSFFVKKESYDYGVCFSDRRNFV